MPSLIFFELLDRIGHVLDHISTHQDQAHDLFPDILEANRILNEFNIWQPSEPLNLEIKEAIKIIGEDIKSFSHKTLYKENNNISKDLIMAYKDFINRANDFIKNKNVDTQDLLHKTIVRINSLKENLEKQAKL